LRRVGDDPAEVPEGERRRGRVDVAEPGDQVEEGRWLAERGRDGGEDAHGYGGQRRREEVLGEQVPEVLVEQREEPVEQVTVAQLREARPVGSQVDGEPLVGTE